MKRQSQLMGQELTDRRGTIGRASHQALDAFVSSGLIDLVFSASRHDQTQLISLGLKSLQSSVGKTIEHISLATGSSTGWGETQPIQGIVHVFDSSREV